MKVVRERESSIFYYIISALPGAGHKKKKTRSLLWQISFQKTEIFITAHTKCFTDPGSTDNSTETQLG